MLNAAVSLVQAEVSDEAVLSTSFIANSENGKASRLRVSILAGKQSESRVHLAEDVMKDRPTECSPEPTQTPNSGSVEDKVNDLFDTPNWLVDNHKDQERMPVLL